MCGNHQGIFDIVAAILDDSEPCECTMSGFTFFMIL